MRAAFVGVALALAPSGASFAEGEGEREGAGAGASFAGRYEVTGVTIDKATGTQRPIHGTIVLTETDEGKGYSSHIELKTLFPGSDAVAAEVVGTGEGIVTGTTLRGTAETRLVASSVPGVDAGFAYIPRQVSARVRSSSVAEIREDGSISVEIDNEGAPGEVEYTPTHTRLVGYRPEPR